MENLNAMTWWNTSGEHLQGFLFTEKAWVQSYGTRCVKPPIVWEDVSWMRPITVEYAVYAQSLTNKPVKGMLTGPVTILNWSFPREDVSLEEQALQIALAVRKEVLALEEHGIGIIQIDEAALKEKLPLRRSDWHEKSTWTGPFPRSASCIAGSGRKRKFIRTCAIAKFRLFSGKSIPWMPMSSHSKLPVPIWTFSMP